MVCQNVFRLWERREPDILVGLGVLQYDSVTTRGSRGHVAGRPDPGPFKPDTCKGGNRKEPMTYLYTLHVLSQKESIAEGRKTLRILINPDKPWVPKLGRKCRGVAWPVC